MAPNLAAAILFEALADQPGQAMPTEPTEVEAFLADQLRPAIERQLGARRAAQVLDTIRPLLEAVLGAAPPQAQRRPSQYPTANEQLESGPVRVLIVATKARLANGLRSALGKDEVEPYWAPNAEVVARILGGLRPSMVLVDGADHGVDDESIEAIGRHPDQLLVLVWSPNEPTGVIASRRLASSAHRVVPLSDENAAEMLVDYVRARRARA